MKALDYIRVVLVEPTHPGNIGASARAMANMGVSDLALVNPRDFPSDVADARAAGADHVLERAVVVDTLIEAISDCTLVLGATARLRSVKWPAMPPWEAMQQAGAHAGESRVAILFGRESSGLTNSELDHCHGLVRIPVDEDFHSLNLASAVMVLLYELRKGLLSAEPRDAAPDGEPLAGAGDMDGFYRHLESVLDLVEFRDERSTTLMRKIIRMFNRIHPTQLEVSILRGILSAVQGKIPAPKE